MDAVASKISLVDRRRWCTLHIFAHMRFLEVTIRKTPHCAEYGALRNCYLCDGFLDTQAIASATAMLRSTLFWRTSEFSFEKSSPL